ncbi:hypothetical protein IAT40_004405 [Kwoniella sp. CBS 6097]
MAPAPHPPLTPFGSALAGALGSVFANAVVYPLDTVKTRLQAEEFPEDEDDDDDDDDEDENEADEVGQGGDDEQAVEGRIGTGEKDVEAVLQAKSNFNSIGTSSMKDDDNLLQSSSEAKVRAKAKGKVGAIEKYLSVKLKRWGMLRMLVRIISRDGLGGMFHGFGASMIGTFSQQFAYFFFHTLLRSTYIKRLSASSPSSLPPPGSKGQPSPHLPVSLSTSSELLLGALAGALAQIFTIPVQVIATRQQLWKPTPHHHGHQYSHSKKAQTHAPSLMETAQEIISEKGLTGLWTGLKPGLVLTVNPAITYGAFERLKSLRLAQRGASGNGKLGVGEAFWLGVGSKTLATIVTYPYIFAKVRLQAKAIIDPPESETELNTSTSSSTTGILGATPPAPGQAQQAKQDSPPSESDSANPTPPTTTNTQTQSTESNSNSNSNSDAAASAPSYASVASAPPSFGSAVVSSNHSAEAEGFSSAAQPSARPTLSTRGSSHTHHQHHHYDDALTLLKAVYKEHGWRGWYQGLGAQITKAVLCQGILFVSKEQFESYAWLMMVFFANLRKSVLPF